MTRTARALAVLAALGGGIAAGLLLWRIQVPALDLPDVEAGKYFSAAELERARGFRSLTRGLWAGSAALELAVAAAAAWQARRLARLVSPWARGRVRTGVALALGVVLGAWLAALPLGGVAHWWRRRHALSEQGYPAWLGDEAIGLGVRAVLVALAVAGAVALAVRLGARWWLAAAPALACLGLLFVLAQPLAVQPLTNRFEPIRDRALAAEIARLGRRLGVRVDRVEVADASRRTTAANAYVAGIGPTRRVVLYDTLLGGDFPRAEVLAVSAHELAHVGRRHLWKGAGWFGLLAVPGLALAAFLTERRGGLRDPALVPLALLVALAFFTLTLPLQNAVSRRYEAEADWLALTATRDPAAAVALERRLALSGLADPDPPGWATVWLATHPATVDRIAAALAFASERR